jgi:TorA maturation chaperone TorD
VKATDKPGDSGVHGGRAAVYHALAVGFAEPSPALAAAIDSGELVAALRDAVTWLAEDAAAYEPALAQLTTAAAPAGLPPDERTASLAVEYARLFTGPGRPAVMCYASQYLDADERGPGRLNGAAAAYADAAYQEHDVMPAPERREFADHVTLEIEFLFYLCRREEAAWADDDGEAALAWRRALDTFLREHAARWLLDFADAVRGATTVDLYEGLADLLRAHLSIELGGSISAAGAGEPRRRAEP